jgi:hypothetical protein
MASIPNKIAERLTTSLKRFQPVVDSARSRDVNESDTVIIVTDMLSDLFGYDKYSEITSELCIKGSYCDLATKVDGQLQFLVEVKAAGTELKDAHVKQAVDYAANLGVDWVVLTNASTWKVFKVGFTKPVTHELVIEFALGDISSKRSEDIETLYLIAREGIVKSALGDFNAQRQALNRFCITAVLVSEPVLDVMRRELRRISPDVKIENEQIRKVLTSDVLKRDVIEGDKADEARRKVSRAASRVAKAKTASEQSQSEEPKVPDSVASKADAATSGSTS